MLRLQSLCFFVNPAMKVTSKSEIEGKLSDFFGVEAGEKTVPVDKNGFTLIFGVSEDKLADEGIDFSKANTVGVIAFVIALVSVIMLALFFIPGKFRYMLAAVLLIVAGIMIFLVPKDMSSSVIAYKPDKGFILAGVFAFVGALLSIVGATLDFKK